MLHIRPWVTSFMPFLNYKVWFPGPWEHREHELRLSRNPGGWNFLLLRFLPHLLHRGVRSLHLRRQGPLRRRSHSASAQVSPLLGGIVSSGHRASLWFGVFSLLLVLRSVTHWATHQPSAVIHNSKVSFEKLIPSTRCFYRAFFIFKESRRGWL